METIRYLFARGKQTSASVLKKGPRMRSTLSWVTGFLLILFAAGLVAHGVHEFNEVGWIPSVVEHVWNVDAIISESSLPGQLLQTLFGYNSSPALTEMIAYFGYLAVVIFLWRRENDIVPVKKATAESQA